MNECIYLDYAAATPVDERVFASMKPYFSDAFYNPSSVYIASRAIKSDVQEARSRIAHWLGSRPSEVVFTAGATEANNLAINGICSRYTKSHVVISSIEHEAIVAPTQAQDNTVVPVDARGMIDIDTLSASIVDETVLVSVIYANNEIGTVQHMADISSVIDAERIRRKQAGSERPIYFHSDASQAANYLDLHVSKLGVDLLTLNSAKTYGPKQVGALYVRAGIALSASVLGGGQEKGMRSGTENVAGIIGFARALDIAQKSRKDEGLRLQKLKQRLAYELPRLIEGAAILGHPKHALPNLVSVQIPGVDGERLIMMLDEQGFQCATGSACSAQSDESSHVIRALGRSDQEAQSTLRVSMGRFTLSEHVDQFIEVLPRLVAEARELQSS